MAGVFTFDEASHEYRLDGRRLPSVTQILAPIKPDFSAVAPSVLEAKRGFGVSVHLACELDDQGELEDAGTDARVLACVDAWRLFRRAAAVEVLLNEQRLFHPTMWFAGTVDRLALLGGEPWLLDIKTADEAHASFGVQLCGYQLLVEASHDPAVREATRELNLAELKRGTVHLFDDGTYRLHRYKNPNDEAAFRACLALSHWKEANQ